MFATRRLPKDLWRGSTKRRLDAPSAAMWAHQRRMIRPLDAVRPPSNGRPRDRRGVLTFDENGGGWLAIAQVAGGGERCGQRHMLWSGARVAKEDESG